MAKGFWQGSAWHLLDHAGDRLDALDRSGVSGFKCGLARIPRKVDLLEDVRTAAQLMVGHPADVKEVVREVSVPVDKPVVPVTVEQEVKQKTGLWSWITGLFSSGALGLGWLAGMDWQAIVAIGGVVLVFLAVIFLMRRQIIAGVNEIREGLA